MSPENSQEEPLTYSRFVKFYQDFIEPRFAGIEKKLEEHDRRFEHVDQRFEDLYGKFERLEQEYYICNKQIQRLTLSFDAIREGLQYICTRLAQQPG